MAQETTSVNKIRGSFPQQNPTSRFGLDVDLYHLIHKNVVDGKSTALIKFDDAGPTLADDGPVVVYLVKLLRLASYY